MKLLGYWIWRAAGFALTMTLLTGNANAQQGRAEIKGQVVGIRQGEESPRGLGGALVELKTPNQGTVWTGLYLSEDGRQRKVLLRRGASGRISLVHYASRLRTA